MASESFQSWIADQLVTEIETQLVESPDHGADIRFHGAVRRTEDAREISGIRYSFYQGMAERELKAIGKSMMAAHPDHLALVYHRVGFVRAGEASILIRVQTAHSAEAFELIREYLMRIKQTVPIWKEPIYIN